MWKLTDSKSYKIQILRGLAILAVVLIHNSPAGISQAWCRPLINFSVGMFLFLSGMLSSAERWNPKKRIMKVAIPYVIWTLIYALIGHIKDPFNIPMAFIINLITAVTPAVMYYVFVYCELTLLIPLIDRLARSRLKCFGFVISPLEIIFIRLIPLITGYEINEYIRPIIHVSCLGWFTYYYLGYLLGNGLLKIRFQTSTMIIMWVVSVGLQIAEGLWYFSMGSQNCGTQLKLTAVLSGVLFILLGYRYLDAENVTKPKVFHVLGDYSFGIFFSHLAVMAVLAHIPYYRQIAVFPLNAVIAIFASWLCVVIGRNVLGKFAKFLAL